MNDIPPYPLYNRTYNLYRLSPLHHGETPLLAGRTLRTHAKRLKEQLKGDNVRGVQVDFASAEDTAKLGPLEECSWALLGDEDSWIDHHRQLQDPEASQSSQPSPPTEARGIEVSLEYEKQSYNALLLRDSTNAVAPDGFSALPLLLVKMPGPVREVFLQYLRTTFDAYVAPLKLPSTFITASMETYFKHLSASASTQSIQDVVRQLNIQLAFPDTTTLVKHIDVTIAAADVPGFVTRGKHARDNPFTAALSSYLAKHLALDVSHPKVQVSRISCNSFHLGTERLKLAAPDTLADTSFSDEGGASQDASAGQLAVEEFLTSLAREAAGSGKFLPDDLSTGPVDSTSSSTTSAKAGRRKRTTSTATTANGNNKKRSKAKSKETDEDTDGI
ncbi:uncharacterized protein EKO05_0000977 [Ascochyta rabiei]|uniref:Uncharacterized protein n=1 Tax=Didymella rabiei TaxID=5454 RepID=A0A163BB83_DIDRA|nr:uncharacterized protein EKO05_0000977 [Ascochyta rabiei]KZM21668.1 hypothetical protein ST47_g7192 [Ascochyta rabiei]UPX10310.1 hypothetical protein EKO05_0000977 [Ascochyta rabiei]